MKIFILHFIIVLLLSSCIETQSSFDKLSESEKIQIIDSFKTNFSKERALDTSGMSDCPILITKKEIIKKEYSNYKDISLCYKNIGKKTITAIRFKWYGENAFGELADMGGFEEGAGGGYTDDILRPNKIDCGTWGISSRDAKKVIGAYATEIVFDDDTKWKKD
jgi:hypothetical protein